MNLRTYILALQAALFSLLLAVSPAGSGSLTLLGAGKPSAAVAYSGPIDINGAAYAFWSTRCGATAYAGNVMEVWDSATGSTTQTIVTCSAGGTLNETVNSLATTCASGCRVKTWYDQSGNARHASQATNANRIPLTTSCLSGKMCLAPTGVAGQMLETPLLATQAQPMTWSVVANRTGNTSSLGQMLATSGSNVNFTFSNSTNQVSMWFSGTTTTATANDNTTHAMQVLASGASSFMSIDGTTTSAAAAGTTGLASSDMFDLMGVVSVQPMTGNMFEIGVWASNVTANNSTMNSNQHAYWGF